MKSQLVQCPVPFHLARLTKFPKDIHSKSNMRKLYNSIALSISPEL